MCRSDADPSLFYKRFGDGTQLTILLHVDDAIVMYNCSAAVAKSHEDALQKRFDMSFNQGVPDYFLGLNLTHSTSSGEISLSCQTYIRTMAEQFLKKPLTLELAARCSVCS